MSVWTPRTLVVTDRRRLGGRDAKAALVAFARAVADAGVDALQVRERDWADGELLAVVGDVGRAVRGTSCRVLVNERAHVALAVGVDGVHLRSDAMPARRLREVCPSAWLIGRSVHEPDLAEAALGADYVTFGTVFPSVSKGAGAPVAGLEALASWVNRAGAVPVLAVGGIDLARCALVRDAGASGIAAIDLFASAYESGPTALATVVRGVHAVFGRGER